MNQPSHQSQGTQSGNSFPSQQGSQTNPFTADLKGEFTSNFGTNSTNAMSQIFKDGSGFGGNNTKRWVLMGAFLLVAAGAAYYLLSEDPIDDLSVPTADELTPEPSEATPADTATAGKTATDAVAQPEAVPQEAVATEAAPTGNISLSSPVDGDSRAYDETSGPAKFSWDGGAGTIVFARSSSMSPVYMRVPVSGSSYNFYNPYPGTWYWKVENASGSSEVRRFTVEPPARRAVALKEPANGATLAATGGTIAWSGDPERKVAFYRVEFSADGKWGNPAYRFASSGEGTQTQGMNPGSYQMRLGAFSEVAGRWEYTDPVQVNVQ
jgi:hypothetical protein